MATIASLEIQLRSLGRSVVEGDLTAIGQALFAVAEESVKTALELNEIEQVFRKMIPTAEGAQEAIDGIRKVAENSDFGFESLEKTAGVLLRMKVPGDQVVDTMGAIVNAVGAIEGTEQDINTVAMAIGRMNVSGEVTQRQLKALADAFPDTYKILREELGLTQEEIMNISDQNLEGAEVANALLKGMFETTATGTENAADETAQQLKNLNDNVTQLYESFGKELLPLIQPAITWINDALKDTDRIAKSVVLTIQIAAGLMTDLLNKLPSLSDALGGLAKAAAALDSLDPTGVLGLGELATALNAAGYLASVGAGGGSAGGGSPSVLRPPGFIGPPAPPSLGGAGGSGGGAGGAPDFGLTGPGGGLDEWGNSVNNVTKDFEELSKELTAQVASAEDFAATLKDLGEAGLISQDALEEYAHFMNQSAAAQAEDLKMEQAEDAASIAADSALEESVWGLNESVGDAASGMDLLKEAQDGFMDEVFKVEQRFSSLDDAISKLSVSIVIGSESIDSLFPELKGAGELFQKMNQQIREVTVGEGAGALAAFHSIVAQNEASLRLLAFMEATGQGVQDMGVTMGAGTDAMSTAFDDLLASFQNSTDAIHRNAEALQAVTDTQLVSVAAGMAGAAAGAAAVNSGLVQLSAGLAQYGQMAATGTLPGGLPGGIPGQLNPGGGLTGPNTGGSITNPFAPPGGTWGGGQHGFPPSAGGNWGGGITIGFDNNGFSQFLRVMNSSWAGQNAVGQR